MQGEGEGRAGDFLSAPRAPWTRFCLPIGVLLRDVCLNVDTREGASKFVVCGRGIILVHIVGIVVAIRHYPERSKVLGRWLVCYWL